MTTTAAVLVIGNEILTGKVAEQNVLLTAKELFALGVELRRVVICPDEVPTIVRDLRELAAAHDIVITSGGVGPTHDDVTIKAVAEAFSTHVVRAPEYEGLIREYYGDRVTEAHLRMAAVPEGARLLTTPEMRWPTIAMHNVYVFPGVPQIFKAKLGLLREELKTTVPFFSRAVYLMLDEPSVAPLLDEVSAAHPDVSIGSYLHWGNDADYRTKLTVDGRSEQRVEACFSALLDGLSPDSVVRKH